MCFIKVEEVEGGATQTSQKPSKPRNLQTNLLGGGLTLPLLLHPPNADKSEGEVFKHLIFDSLRLNRCRGCIPEVRGVLTD